MPSSWICVDASLVVRLIVDIDDQIVRERWQEWTSENRQIAAPSLLHYEVTNALYQYHRHGYLGEESLRLAQEAALALPIQLHGDEALHRAALRLARRLSLSATYDAHYLALKGRLNAEMWTSDRRLVNAVKDEISNVHFISEQ